MIAIAPISSRMATAVRNTRNDSGTRLPTTRSTASENAMSVAHGIAQPRAATASPRLSARKISAGTIIPPNAAMAGSAMRSRLESCPSTISRLISRPT